MGERVAKFKFFEHQGQAKESLSRPAREVHLLSARAFSLRDKSNACLKLNITPLYKENHLTARQIFAL